MRRITRFKINKAGKVRCEYEIARGEEEFDEYGFTSKDKPVPELENKFKEFGEYVDDICELNLEEHQMYRLEVRGFSFSYAGDKEVMGCTITAIKKLSNSNSPLILNTPHKIAEFYSDHGSEKQLMPDGMYDDLKELCELIQKYIDGERAQEKLNFSEEKTEVTVEIIQK